MGAGIHGGFGYTKGYLDAIAGNAIYKSGDKLYFNYISKRKDIDVNGQFDFIAHGTHKNIKIEHNGKDISINSRIVAKLIKNRKDYKKGQPIRLLSCNTGSGKNSFAQNLANKLGVTVYAPTKMIWAWPNGNYGVYGSIKNKIDKPNLNDIGYIKAFHPRRKK